MSLKEIVKVANYYELKYSFDLEEDLDQDFEELESYADDHDDMVKLAAGKYDHIDFKPSESVAKAA